MQRSTSTKTYPAQILLVSLLVLMIIAVIVVGVVGVASRDILQTQTNQQYQKVYNASESTITKLIDKYGDASVSLGNLVAEPFTTGSCVSSGASTYECTFSDQGITTNLQVNDTPVIKDYEITKDGSLEMNLAGFRGNMTLNWTGTTAMEFGLIYDVNGKSSLIGDLYDASNVFDFSGNPPTQRSNPEDHAFLFSTDPSGGITFKVDNIVGLPPTAKTVSLRLTARMPTTQGVTKVNVTADNGLPNQIREFVATSFDSGSDVQSTATVVTQIPLLATAPSPFNYALLTKDAVDKSKTAPPPAAPPPPTFSCNTQAAVNGYCPGNQVAQAMSGTSANYKWTCCTPASGANGAARGACVDVPYTTGQETHCPANTFMIGAAQVGGVGRPTSIRCCNYSVSGFPIKSNGTTSTLVFTDGTTKTCDADSLATGVGDKILPDSNIDQFFCTPASQ